MIYFVCPPVWKAESWQTADVHQFGVSTLNVSSRMGFDTASLRVKLDPLLRQTFQLTPQAELGPIWLSLLKLQGDSIQDVPWHRHAGHHISFHLALSARGVDYHGGGTELPLFQYRINLEKGEGLFHGARLHQTEHRVDNGTSYVLVGAMTAPSVISLDLGMPLSFFVWPMWGWLPLCGAFDLKGETASICNTFYDGIWRDFRMDPTLLFRFLLGQNSIILESENKSGESSSSMTMILYVMAAMLTYRLYKQHTAQKQREQVVPNTAAPMTKKAEKAAAKAARKSQVLRARAK